LIDTLYKRSRESSTTPAKRAPHDRIEGLEHIDKIIDIDQSPIGRTPRSNPATYTGAVHADPRMVRRAPRSQTRAVTSRGGLPFNVKAAAARLPGRRVIKIEVHFLPDVYVTCDV